MEVFSINKGQEKQETDAERSRSKATLPEQQHEDRHGEQLRQDQGESKRQVLYLCLRS